MRGNRRGRDLAVSDRILDAAADAFAEKGFGGARVDAIARRARVNKALLYYYVGDKKELYEAVLLRNFAALCAAMDRAAAGPGGAEERLRRAIHAVLSTMRAIPNHPRLMFREVAGGAEHLSEPVFREMAGVFRRIRGLLEDGRREGVFRDVDPFLAHLEIFGGIVFVIAASPIAHRLKKMTGVASPLDLDTESLSQRLSDLVLGGLRRSRGGSGRTVRRGGGKP